jgi:hypothetical protein
MARPLFGVRRLLVLSLPAKPANPLAYTNPVKVASTLSSRAKTRGKMPGERRMVISLRVKRDNLFLNIPLEVSGTEGGYFHKHSLDSSPCPSYP